MLWQRGKYGFAWEGRVHLPLLARQVDVLVEAEPHSGGPTAPQSGILRRICSLDAAFTTLLVGPLLGYVAQIEEYSGERFDLSPTSVLQSVELKRLTIPPMGPRTIGIFVLSGDCSWEEEHGIDVRVDLDSGAIDCASEGTFLGDWDRVNCAKDWDLWSSKGRDWARREGAW